MATPPKPPVNAGQPDNQSRGAVYVPPAKKLKKAGHMGYEFPVTSVSVQGGIRDHIHEYPHADGGAAEKLGRRVYIIKMHAIFFTNGKEYPYLWPNKLNYLRTYWERQTTGPLVIPTIGTIQAYCRNWTTEQTNKVLSGETADLEFVEDQGSQALVESLLDLKPTFVEAFGTYNASMLLAEFAKEADVGLFDAIANAVNGVLAYADTIDAASNLISAKLLALADMCALADKTLTAQDPMNEPLLQALRNIWDTANGLSDVQMKGSVPVRTYVTKTGPLAINQISAAIYNGDSSRGVELLQLNPIADAFAVPAGTKVKYVDDGPVQLIQNT